MTDPKLQTTADLAQQLRDVIPPAPHFLAMLEELERRAYGEQRHIEVRSERVDEIMQEAIERGRPGA